MKSSDANKYVAGACGQTQDVPLDRFELAALPHNAALARERIRAVCDRLGFQSLETGEVEVAFGEAVNNAILYGSPHPDSLISVICCLRQFAASELPVLVIQIHDQGKGFDADHVPASEVGTDALGGRGISLMRALMDGVLLYYDGAGMVVRMARRVPAAKSTE